MADLKSPSVAVADSKVESTAEVCTEVDVDEEEMGIEGAVPVDLRWGGAVPESFCFMTDGRARRSMMSGTASATLVPMN